jgi:hypothetical protein
VELGPDGRSLRLYLTWGEPHAGSGYDEFSLLTPDVMSVTSHVDCGGQQAGYTVVLPPYRSLWGLT